MLWVLFDVYNCLLCTFFGCCVVGFCLWGVLLVVVGVFCFILFAYGVVRGRSCSTSLRLCWRLTCCRIDDKLLGVWYFSGFGFMAFFLPVFGLENRVGI